MVKSWTTDRRSLVERGLQEAFHQHLQRWLLGERDRQNMSIARKMTSHNVITELREVSSVHN
jgi:hypothetical protein